MAAAQKKTPRSQILRTWGFKWREPDSNRRPRGYEPRELPGCSIPRHFLFVDNSYRPRGLRILTKPGEKSSGPAAFPQKTHHNRWDGYSWAARFSHISGQMGRKTRVNSNSNSDRFAEKEATFVLLFQCQNGHLIDSKAIFRR